MIEEGETAPGFTARDQNGEEVSLQDFRGRRVILYFYPKDDTPGCTSEACAFRDAHDTFEERNVAVISVSADDVESHAAFQDEYDLPFTLLADPDKEIINAYGVEGARGNAKRVTFLIDEAGDVERIYRDVDPEHHAEQLLEDL